MWNDHPPRFEQGGEHPHFEIALNGQTSQDVATGIEDGSFGMAEETGAYMNQAIQGGCETDWALAKNCWWSEMDRWIFEKLQLVMQSPWALPLARQLAAAGMCTRYTV